MDFVLQVMASPADAWNKYRKWCRLVILLHEGGEKIVKDILGQMGVDITDGVEIYQKLKPHEKTVLKKMPRYLQPTLLPASGVVDATKLDFSARCHIIEILDTSKQFPLIGELRNRRNEFFHMSVEKKDMTGQEFNKYWKEISQLLTDFNYDVNMLIGLKTDDQFDHIKGNIQKSFLYFTIFFKWQYREQSIN